MYFPSEKTKALTDGDTGDVEKREFEQFKNNAREHEVKADHYAAKRKLSTEIAKSSDVSLLERGKAAGNAVMDGVQELKEAGLKMVDNKRAENALYTEKELEKIVERV